MDHKSRSARTVGKMRIALTALAIAYVSARSPEAIEDTPMLPLEATRGLGSGAAASNSDEDLLTFGWNTFRMSASPFSESLGARADLKPIWSRDIGGVFNAHPSLGTPIRCGRHYFVGHGAWQPLALPRIN